MSQDIDFEGLAAEADATATELRGGEYCYGADDLLPDTRQRFR